MSTRKSFLRPLLQFRLSTLLALVAGLAIGFAPLKLWERWQSPSPAIVVNLELMEFGEEASELIGVEERPVNGYHEVDLRLLERLADARQEGKIEALSSPTVMTLTGQPAQILVGGEVPLPVVSDQGIESVEMKEYGTKVTLVPTLLRNGLIRLDYDIALGTPGDLRAVTVRNLTVPEFIHRRFSGQMELPSGLSVLFRAVALPEEQTGSASREVWIKLTASSSKK